MDTPLPTEPTGTISLSRDELLKLAEEDVEFYGLDLNRISSVFLAQFFSLKYGQVLTTGNISDEIKKMEGLKPGLKSQTKPASKLTSNPHLRGLWHKHFTDPQFFLRNIGNHFKLDGSGNKRLEQVISEAFKRNTSGYVDDEFCMFLAHQVTIGGYQDRSKEKKLTGEWIVFQQHQGENYYLTLGFHGDDERTLHHVNGAVDMDFPFLKGTFGT